MRHEALQSAYQGDTARDYDSLRMGRAKWVKEEEAVDAFLRKLPKSTTLLDIPVGTGRFVHLYAAHGLHATGVDVSADMMAQAGRKANERGYSLTLTHGDVCRIPFDDCSFDVCLCMRLLNWLDRDRLDAAIFELGRVAKKYVIVGVRLWSPIAGIGLRSRVAQAWSQMLHMRGPLVVHDYARTIRVFRKNGLVMINSNAVAVKKVRGVEVNTNGVFLFEKVDSSCLHSGELSGVAGGSLI